MSNTLDKSRRELMAEMFAPEAEEFVAILKADKMPVTKNNYGRAMALLGRMPNREMKDAFIDAMIHAGYDEWTGDSLRRLV